MTIEKNTVTGGKKINIQTIIPSRYTSRKLKFINIYHVYQDYVKLLIIHRIYKNIEISIFFEKEDYLKVSQYHWGGTDGTLPPCTVINKIPTTIGKVIRGTNFRSGEKIKGKPLWDFRKNHFLEPGNIYTSVDEITMKLEIKHKNNHLFSVIFDKEDYAIILKHKWWVAYDSCGNYSVITRVRKKQISLHRFILEAHGHKLGNKGFTGIKPIENKFDYRKSVLIQKYALNTYSVIDVDTMELTINSVHGVVKVIFDSKDFEKISNVCWGYKSIGKARSICNQNQLLKRYILGEIKQNFKYIIDKKDDIGRFDYRRKTLLE